MDLVLDEEQCAAGQPNQNTLGPPVMQWGNYQRSIYSGNFDVKGANSSNVELLDRTGTCNVQTSYIVDA